MNRLSKVFQIMEKHLQLFHRATIGILDLSIVLHGQTLDRRDKTQLRKFIDEKISKEDLGIGVSRQKQNIVYRVWN
jgi:hypothetical protein